MIRSMTGFARCEARDSWGSLAWELRAFNHRYLDVVLRLPEEFRVLETALREIVTGELKRGKVEGSLRYQPSQTPAAGLQINDAFVLQLIQAARRIAKAVDKPARLDPIRLLAWPGVVSEPERDPAPVHQACTELLRQTVRSLGEARAREGTRIEATLLERCSQLEELVAAVRARLPEVSAAVRERLQKRLAQLEAEADPDRLEQELVLIAQKSDVDEELERLDSHICELRHVLTRNEPVGRRLDFLMQEFNREANTLASKSSDAETTRAAVNMKVAVEQMREQVQNVE